MDMVRHRFECYPRQRVCRFYLEGRCAFGPRCRNLHVGQPQYNHHHHHHHFNHPQEPPYQPPDDDLKPPQLPQTSLDEDRICGICFDVVLHKSSKAEQVFGILPNCNHCFCFGCILRWRRSREFDFDVIKACPECRTTSDFVYPSRHWVSNKEDKERFISERKAILATIDCQYFLKGTGRCPFGNKCLYLHRLDDGRRVDVGPPLQRASLHRSGLMQRLAEVLRGDHGDMFEERFGTDFFDIW